MSDMHKHVTAALKSLAKAADGGIQDALKETPNRSDMVMAGWFTEIRRIADRALEGIRAK